MTTSLPQVIRVILPVHLRTLAGLGREVEVSVEGDVTPKTLLDALEAGYPTLRGTIRDQLTGVRRPFVRFFACGEDLSHDPVDTPVPDRVRSGEEPFVVLGAMAGG